MRNVRVGREEVKCGDYLAVVVEKGQPALPSALIPTTVLGRDDNATPWARGSGLLLAKKVVDELIYSEQGNEVLLVKYVDTAIPRVAQFSGCLVSMRFHKPS